MNQISRFESIESRLRAVAMSRQSPASVREQAENLLSRLTSPVRVSLLGLPDAGKQGLVNALVGGNVIAETMDLPTIEVRFGTETRVQVTLQDGTVEEREGQLEAECLSQAVLIVIERPLPLLRRISLLSVMADASVQDQRAATAWAARRTDIALWCSAKFSKTDEKLWSEVPDSLRDHAYLVLTNCDAERASQVKDEMAGEFVDVYSLDLSPEAVDQGATGVDALSTRIIEHADLGRQADADSALFFLRASEQDPAIAAKLVEPAPVPAAEKKKTSAAPAAPARPVTRPRMARVPHAETYSTGLTLLRRFGMEALKELRAGHPDVAETLPGRCTETLQQLADILNACEEDGVDKISHLIDSVYEAESLVILMENEASETSAIEAVSILLQMRRDLETCLAA
jgi:hypothetical protein